ncbi:nucleotidyltransferase family protein [Novosphingobium mangrovi (ex Huang et al. 2023)]|uniref:Nucleotidyltransferase family protein n=1 Tax=Novosphingobium mangrovi (ex Huang et al. 2023) TaxID=2976432 RepID=A0ABT2I703_9SPHN|nr:nucleotidyltransferase family protein [Novosphingobium mangrovi (ex Huang et al. 2023)]MCT2400592.1 nucleotidyltransferase family protein [Novosphingobium mangrovi (ex Huang et al. 2023)]
MDLQAELASLLTADPLRMEALRAVRALDLPDGWIGAGFVRDAVWDRLHGHSARPPVGDVDVIWHSRERTGHSYDEILEARLRASMPGLDWSVRNQARMHPRNGDRPYRSTADAMTHWPETATAVAARLDTGGGLEINAPLGLADLFSLRLRPTAHFAGARRPTFDLRVTKKRWLERYPALVLA